MKKFLEFDRQRACQFIPNNANVEMKLIDRKVVKAQEIKWRTEGKVTSF